MPLVPFIIVIALGVTPLGASADTINGCVNQKNGKLRIVGVPGQCKTSETLVTWESEGGTTGPQGPQGPAGPAGPQGNPAPAPSSFVLVGFSTGTHVGDDGLLAFSGTCADDIPGSRLCTSLEVLETPNMPSGLTGTAWVRPFVMPDGTGASGRSNPPTCGAWTNGSSGSFGLIMLLDDEPALAPELAPYSGFFTSRCDAPLPIACCAPAP